MDNIIQSNKIILLSFFIIFFSCEKGKEGCTLIDACNFDEMAIINDNSCWFPSDGCNCDDMPGALVDCLGICDNNIYNDPPSNDGVCNESVVGGCIDSLICNYNPNATHNDGSCAVSLSHYGGSLNGEDCEGVCQGKAVMDGCYNSSCIGGLDSILNPWKIIISIKAIFISSITGDLLGIDSSTVTIGVSEYALDGYNDVEQAGGDLECTDDCYIDIFESPQGLNNNLVRFFFPHEEWINDIDSFLEPNFIQDIRYYDLFKLFSDNGIQWDAVISPINLSYSSIVENLSISYKLEGAIDSFKFNFIIDGNPLELVEGELTNYFVNSDREIELLINISNICID